MKTDQAPTTGQLFAWILLQPTTWRHRLSAIAPELAPDFCLLALPRSAWHNVALQQLLFRLYVIPTLCSGIAIGLLTLPGDWLTPFALWGWALGALIGLIFGVLVSAAAGAVVMLIAALLFGLRLGWPGFILLDLLTDFDLAILFALIGTSAHYVISNLTHRRFAYALFKQMGSFVLGLLISIVAAFGIIGLLILFIDSRQNNSLIIGAPALYISSITFVLIGVAGAWRANRWWVSFLFSGVFAVVIGLAFGTFGIAFSDNPGGYRLIVVDLLNIVLIYLILFLLPFVLADRIAGLWAGSIAGALGTLALHPVLGAMIGFYALWSQLIVGSAITLLGITFFWWRPYLFYPLEAAWNTLLQRFAEEYPHRATRLLHWHAAFWDETQYLPLWGLDHYLLLALARDPPTGTVALETILGSNQRWAAVEAQIELDARRLARCTTVGEISAACNGLTAIEIFGPASPLLRQFSTIGTDIAVALDQVSQFNQRLVLSAAEQDLNAFALDLTRSTDRYAQRFQSVAHLWQQIVAARIAQLSTDALIHREIQNPYVVGVPLTKHQEIFVGRKEISLRIENFLRGQDHPPLLLYGQRRMGKTSLLYNLRWMLPHRILPIVVDLEGPIALAADHASFLYNFAKGMLISAQQQSVALAPLTRAALADDPFTRFDDWLDAVEATVLQKQHETILLALDEFEALDRAITKERLDEGAILGTLRHIIQHRPRFKLLLAGSHTLGEFRRWSGYLINAQTIHLSYLHEDETRRLIEEPIKDFTLAYEPTAVDEILYLTRGHPYLVQLFCSEIVIMKNEQPLDRRYLAKLDDVACAVSKTLERGEQFFADIELNQIDQQGRAILQMLAQHDEHGLGIEQLAAQFADQTQFSAVLTRLQQRELLEQEGALLRFQMPLLHRWFQHSGSFG